MSDKNDVTEIVAILDRSGSMDAICEDAIGGFNAFLSEQQALPGKATLTLVLFDHQYFMVHNAKPLADVEPLTNETYRPRGTTALLDAIGRTIDTVLNHRKKMAEKDIPSKTILVVLTDGLENASSDYTRDRVMTMIGEVQKNCWAVEYLAANQDAIQTGQSIGVKAQACTNFVADSKGTRQAYQNASRSVTSYRTGSGKPGAN